MKVDARFARAAVLFAWAGFFVTLWVTDEVTRYLGPRTYWVVQFGSITLTLAALLYTGLAVRSRRMDSSPLTLRESGALAAMVVPIVVVLMVPNAELGSLAASRKAGGKSTDASQLASNDQASTTEDLPFLTVSAATNNPDYARKVGIRAGRSVLVEGFVMDPDAQGFAVGRFVISCCAADSVPVTIPVRARAHGFPQDTWVKVKGTLVKQGRATLVVKALRIEPIETPSRPYITAY